MSQPAVAIPEKIFFKIGEVCEIVGVQAHVLRYWETEFSMLAPQKNRAGQRTYRRRDVEIALRIKELLYDEMYTIAGARKRLANELRGPNKLKVVTNDMQVVPNPASPPAPQPKRQPSHSSLFDDLPIEGSGPMTPEQRIAIRRLAAELRGLLSVLDGDETDGGD